MRLEELDAYRFYGQMLIARGRSGDRSRARDLLAQAVSGYVTFGMPKHKAMGRAALANT
jgi:hypothetical protein